MSDLQSDPDNRNPPSKPVGWGSTMLLILLGLPFAVFGGAAAFAGVRKWAAGNTHDGLFLCIFGFVFSAVGFGLMTGALLARKKSRQKTELEARYADRPWMLRQDWAAGKIKSSTMSQSALYLIMGVGFCGLGGLASYFAVPEVLQKHNYPALFALLFPLAGIGFLIAFINAWRSQKRFGECFFEPAQVPIPIGGVLEGMIETGKPLKLEHELNLKFSCIRRVVTGSGKSRHVNEFALWQTEKIYSEQAVLPEPGPGHTGIPVHFVLPDDQPECFSRGDVSVFWRLEAKSKLRGPHFRAVFDLPVYKVAGAVAAETGDAGGADSDPTAALEAPIEEIRRDEHSRIQVSDGPNGREFYFPPARNPGTALIVTVAMFLLLGVAVATYHYHAPFLFPMISGLMGFLLLGASLSLWFKSSRVTIDSTTVRLANHGLLFSRTRRFPAGDVARFAAKQGMQSGSQVFTDIKLIPRGSDEKYAAEKEKFQGELQAAEVPNVRQVIARAREAAGPPGVIIASNIASVAEANWLVQEMNKALRQTQPGASDSPGAGISPGAPTAARPGAAILAVAILGFVVLVSLALVSGAGYWYWRQSHSAPATPPPAETPASAETPPPAAPKPAQSQPAVLEVAFSSCGSYGNYETDGWRVETNGRADWFVSKSSGRLKAIELKIEPAGQPAKKLFVSIFEDRGGAPGHALEMLSAPKLVRTNSAGWLVLDSRKQPVLETGAKYWVWARSPAGTWYWHFNNQNLVQEAMLSSPPRKWASAGYTNVCAFDVLTEGNP